MKDLTVQLDEVVTLQVRHLEVALARSQAEGGQRVDHVLRVELLQAVGLHVDEGLHVFHAAGCPKTLVP